MSEAQPPERGLHRPATPEEIRSFLQTVRLGPSMAREIDELPGRSVLERRDYQQDITLKKWYAVSILVGLGIQLLVANAVFISYARWGVNWKLEATVVQAWLAATVIEVVGVVLVVTRYLFPRRDRPLPTQPPPSS